MKAEKTSTLFTAPGMGHSPAIRLATLELSEGLTRACPKIKFRSVRSPAHADFLIGTFSSLSPFVHNLPEEDAWRDEIVVRSHADSLILAGSNPRSVLYAVYTWLEQLGFAWIVPGPDGEIIPNLSRIPLQGFRIRHTASLLHRGFALAGAYDVKMGEDFIAWMARNRFNHLYIEGDSSHTWFNKVVENISRQQSKLWDRRLDKAVKARGMILERMGHGWTPWVLGVPPGTPRPKPFRITPRRRRLIAKVGPDEQPRRSPGSHLCLSNPESHRAMVHLVCRYARSHPDVDVLAVWMADGFNNWCECSKCAKVHPSDLWVKLINRLTRELYRIRPDLKLEVLGYSSLMEPPPHEKIDNSRNNVIFMYAPFLRCYLHSLDDPRCETKPPLHTWPPANKLHHPMNADFLRFFKGWRKQFSGANYVFDYYSWLPIKRDIFEGNVPETVCRDLTAYPAHGITGCVDCSRAQSFWPTPLTRWLQGHASWDKTTDYRKERTRLLTLTFGQHARLADRYLSLVYECLLPEKHGREEERGFSARKVRRFKKALPEILRLLSEAVSTSSSREKRFLKRLLVHAEFTDLHVNELLAEAAGQWTEAAGWAERMFQLAHRHKRLLTGVADWPEFCWLHRDTIKRLEQKRSGTYQRID